MSEKSTRREFVKKAAYVTPVVLTIKVKPAHAKSGSAGPERWHHGGGRGHGKKQHYDRHHK